LGLEEYHLLAAGDPNQVCSKNERKTIMIKRLTRQRRDKTGGRLLLGLAYHF